MSRPGAQRNVDQALHGLTADGRQAVDMNGVALAFARTVLHAVLELLEEEPAAAARLRQAVALRPEERRGEKFMNVVTYAAHAKVCDRTIRNLLPKMTEGIHFHRDGRKGRRIIIHVEEADAWRSSRRFAGRSDNQAVADLATNEVLRRRAHVALKKAGVR